MGHSSHLLPGVFGVTLSSLFVVAVSVWTSLYAVNARRNGRKAVERELARRHEASVQIKLVPFWKVHDRAGLTSAVIFDVEAQTADGEARAYRWAYEPGLLTAGGAKQLKRLAHGIWIPA